MENKIKKQSFFLILGLTLFMSAFLLSNLLAIFNLDYVLSIFKIQIKGIVDTTFLKYTIGYALEVINYLYLYLPILLLIGTCACLIIYFNKTNKDKKTLILMFVALGIGVTSIFVLLSYQFLAQFKFMWTAIRYVEEIINGPIFKILGHGMYGVDIEYPVKDYFIGMFSKSSFLCIVILISSSFIINIVKSNYKKVFKVILIVITSFATISITNFLLVSLLVSGWYGVLETSRIVEVFTNLFGKGLIYEFLNAVWVVVEIIIGILGIITWPLDIILSYIYSHFDNMGYQWAQAQLNFLLCGIIPVFKAIRVGLLIIAGTIVYLIANRKEARFWPNLLIVLITFGVIMNLQVLGGIVLIILHYV